MVLSEVWINLAELLSRYLGADPLVVQRLLITLAIIGVYALLRLATSRLAARQIANTARRYVVVKTIHYAAGLVVLVAILRIWSVAFSNIFTYLGLVSAALVISLQVVIANLAGWLAIALQKPFVVGDRIRIGTTAGDVVDISLFNFTLLEVSSEEAGEQSTGRLVHMPNGVVFRESIANYTQGMDFVWNEVRVHVAPSSNWLAARETLTRLAGQLFAEDARIAADALGRAGQRYMLHYGRLTPIVWTNFDDKRVVLTVRHLCRPRQRRVSSALLWEQILTEFAKQPDIELV
jgi:small-conductance mechanosensitive channel